MADQEQALAPLLALLLVVGDQQAEHHTQHLEFALARSLDQVVGLIAQHQLSLLDGQENQASLDLVAVLVVSPVMAQQGLALVQRLLMVDLLMVDQEPVLAPLLALLLVVGDQQAEHHTQHLEFALARSLDQVVGLIAQHQLSLLDGQENQASLDLVAVLVVSPVMAQQGLALVQRLLMVDLLMVDQEPVLAPLLALLVVVLVLWPVAQQELALVQRIQKASLPALVKTPHLASLSSQVQQFPVVAH